MDIKKQQQQQKTKLAVNSAMKQAASVSVSHPDNITKLAPTTSNTVLVPQLSNTLNK